MHTKHTRSVQVVYTSYRLAAKLVGTKSRKLSGQSFSAAWTKKCEHSFEGSKTKIVTASMFVYADFTLPFILQVKPSHSGLTGVLF